MKTTRTLTATGKEPITLAELAAFCAKSMVELGPTATIKATVRFGGTVKALEITGEPQ